jgi:hypothetical protein
MRKQMKRPTPIILPYLLISFLAAYGTACAQGIAKAQEEMAIAMPESNIDMTLYTCRQQAD